MTDSRKETGDNTVSARYRALADVVIDYHKVREPGFGLKQLVQMVV